MHRFCGMCGTPLPQRPITTPGAQSTTSSTRLPIEVSQASSDSGSHSNTVASTAVEETPTAQRRTPDQQRSPADVTAPIEGETATLIPAQEAQPSGTAGAKNYFSQAEQAESLEQFVAGFHYTPPAEEEEVTMTGAKPELDSVTQYEPPTPVSLSDEQTTVAEAREKIAEPVVPAPVVEEAPPIEAAVTQPPPFATEGVREQVPERSRFLDLSDVPAEKVGDTAAPSIGGPSFLGLSDAPATPAYAADYETPRPNHWRAWTAVIVVLILAGLGFFEWRAEQKQSNNGPIGIMKMQIERLKGKKGAIVTPAPSSETATEPAAPSSSKPNGSGPEIQLTPQQKPQTAPPATNNPNAPAEKPANPGAASNAAAPQQSASMSSRAVSGNENTLAQKPPTGPDKIAASNSASSAAGNASPNAIVPNADEPAPKRDNTAKTVPGSEELAKASNASDVAASSAWLWKSVAKGNPEAPIRLANMYIKGDGVPQSCEQAIVLLRSAAAKENAAARSRLGSLYATGTCVPRNRVRAYEYMSSAVEANPNATWARNFKQQLWEQMTPQERAQAQNSR